MVSRRDLFRWHAPEPRATVLVDPVSCTARVDFCAVCVERCPVPGAITMQGSAPVIDDARCDGCGRCVEVCPAPFRALERVDG